MARAFSSKAFPWKIFYRLVFLQSFIVLVALGASGLAGRYFYKRQFIYQVRTQLHGALILLSRNLPEKIDTDWCRLYSKGADFRVTVFATDGAVICDSQGDDAKSESDVSHPEVTSALKLNDFGQSIRRNPGAAEDQFFGAVAVASRGLILRGAVPLTHLAQTMSVLDTSLGLVLAALAAGLTVFAVVAARSLVFPLGRLLVKTQRVLAHEPEMISKADFNRESFDEWLELESNIDHIHRDLAAKTQNLAMEKVELDAVMGAISDAILAVDLEGAPLFFNSRFELLFGGEALRRHQVKLWEIFRDPEILGAFRAALKEEKLASTKAIAWETETGGRRYFSLAVSPLRKQGGIIYGALGIFHDVTELKTAEQMRIDFVANVSHELRTPLTAIKGYAETLTTDMDSGVQPPKEFLAIISRNANRLMSLVEDLLDLSSIESAEFLNKESLSTAELTTRVLKQMQPNFEAKKHRVIFEVQAQSVFADPNRLEQVLINLLDNANKYTPEGGNITLRWETEGGGVLLKVKDTGPGINPEHHSRLFERFYRVDKARSREQGGTGLGLAIVKHIIQRHEGTVWVESRPGQGATFICKFPGSVSNSTQL